MPKCDGVLADVKAKPSGWPAASLDPGCGRHLLAAVPEPRGLAADQLRPLVAGRVVAGVIGPASPQDPHPTGAEATQRPVLALATCPGSFVNDLGPGVLADGDEGPPVDDVPHPPVSGVAEPHLPGPA